MIIFKITFNISEVFSTASSIGQYILYSFLNDLPVCYIIIFSLYVKTQMLLYGNVKN